jgi:hypothetical protein
MLIGVVGSYTRCCHLYILCRYNKKARLGKGATTIGREVMEVLRGSWLYKSDARTSGGRLAHRYTDCFSSLLFLLEFCFLGLEPVLSYC